MQCNLDKYIFQSGQIHFSIWTNTFLNLEKYIFHFYIQYASSSSRSQPLIASRRLHLFSFESQSAKIILNCCSACYQMFNILYIRITLYNKESAKIILDCLRIKSIAQSSCYYCLLQLLILQILQIFLQLLVILLILLSLLILLLLLPPQH